MPDALPLDPQLYARVGPLLDHPTVAKLVQCAIAENLNQLVDCHNQRAATR